MSIRTIIVDDHPLARERLVSLLDEEDDIEIVATAATGIEAVTAVKRYAPDLVFLDVQMPEMDGLTVVETIGIEAMPPTVFVTAYDAYAIKAFDVHALDYLLKPFGRERLRQTLARVRRHLERDRAGALAARLLSVVDELRQPRRSGDRLVIRVDGRVRFIEIDQIDWLEAEGNYVRLHCGEESHLVRDTIARMHERVGEASFFRIHRSRVVNLARIEELRIGRGGDYDVILTDGRMLGLSRLYKDALQQRLAGRNAR
jgi:two-component system LytT family response regulator